MTAIGDANLACRRGRIVCFIAGLRSGAGPRVYRDANASARWTGLDSERMVLSKRVKENALSGNAGPGRARRRSS